eukprot:69314-Chlamydomonas_euryale.AAC.1
MASPQRSARRCTGEGWRGELAAWPPGRRGRCVWQGVRPPELWFASRVVEVWRAACTGADLAPLRGECNCDQQSPRLSLSLSAIRVARDDGTYGNVPYVRTETSRTYVSTWQGLGNRETWGLTAAITLSTLHGLK